MAVDLLDLPAGADPALHYSRPDVEALVWATVADLEVAGGRCTITVWAYMAVPLPAPTGWLTAESVQVDVWGPGLTKAATRERADIARRRLLALPWLDWPGGVVSRVDVLESPWWNPGPETDRPRYTARYEVRAHPRPAIRMERTA
jgi:hypothetical protein